MTPALLALTEPTKVPRAAATRLGETAAALTAAAPGNRYTALLLRLSAVTSMASTLLPLAVAGTAIDADIAALSNSARVLRAAAALLAELSLRLDRQEQVEAMRLAQLMRHAHADVRLVQREYVPLAYQGLDIQLVGKRASVRILPGAESALTALGRDPLLDGPNWDLDQMAAALAKWVTV